MFPAPRETQVKHFVNKQKQVLSVRNTNFHYGSNFFIGNKKKLPLLEEWKTKDTVLFNI